MKLLYTDIERYPMTGVFFDPKTRYISKHNVTDEGRTLCYSYQWHGERKVSFEAEWTNPDFLHMMWELLNEAEAVVTYNGDKYDLKILKWEFTELGLPPPRPFHSIDLIRTVRRQYKLPYYSLDYVCQRLDLGRKLHHNGIQLWLDVGAGCEIARNKMMRYNIQDGRLMPRLYKKLLPWIVNHPNMGLYTDGYNEKCAKCGSTNLKLDTYPHKTKTQMYHQYRCGDCGAWARGRNTIVPPEKRHTILTGVN